MKKKLMFYMLTTLVISLVIVITLFVIMINYQYVESTKKILKSNNNLIIKLIQKENVNNISEFIKRDFTSGDIRVTLIDKDGNVLVDSETNPSNMDNHNTREEVKEARNYGMGYRVRHSESTDMDTMYFATYFGNGYIIRSAAEMTSVIGFSWKHVQYYVGIALFSIAICFLFASKLSQGLVSPIKDLEFMTSRIAAGELDRRVSIYSSDEIGELGKTFNNMARQLQVTLNDSMDKQNKLEAILKSMDSGVIAVDKNFKVIMINPYAKNIFGINKDIIGKNLLDNIRDFELESIFKIKTDEYKEIKILWPKERDLRIKTADINNGKNLIGTVAVVQDVTDIKRLENMRSQFVTNVSHELKTPLTSIKGFAETLKYVENKETKERFLHIINEEAERLTRLINDILTLSHIENTKPAEINEESIDINKLVEDICYLVKNSADNKNISLNIVGEKVPNILGNKDRFKQMLINLIDNAIKYTEKGGNITIGTEVVCNKCNIWVQDTGVGIDQEYIPRLFERFYRVDKARSRAQGGTGLGLAIVKHIVLSFKGEIKVESEVGKGSKFTVSIPIIKGQS
ncbi:two-component system histidine kinase PnpS [Clostridium peptidivorans]|uniref:two-component system histidine kinase PnpS n=1 Tax=Clostridium peptidivorans TaxID=100174 RepID=UPI000BE24469|nr:ATP-binding protein [Clostridium peptidivorans]